jgi:hypothetical protein
MIRCLAICLVALSLAACANKPPACSDEKTIELIKQIFYESLAETQKQPGLDASLLDAMKRDLKLAVSSIRTAATDDKVGKITCDAVLEAEFPSTAKKQLENFQVRRGTLPTLEFANLKVNGLNVSVDIQYSTQLTDDKKQQMVELSGFKGVVDLVSAVSVYGGFKKEAAEPARSDATSVAKPSSEQPPAPATTSEKRTVSGVTLQSFECGDTCQLRYADALGQSHSAICSDAKLCDAWADEPKKFAPLIGAKADLVVGKKFVPEGNVTIDSVLEVKLLGGR